MDEKDLRDDELPTDEEITEMSRQLLEDVRAAGRKMRQGESKQGARQ